MTTQDRQHLYVDQHCREVSFDPKDCIFLKVSPINGGVRFGMQGKLSPTYIEPFEVLEQVGEVSCRLALPSCLSLVNLVFDVSMLKKYIPDGLHKLSCEGLNI